MAYKRDPLPQGWAGGVGVCRSLETAYRYKVIAWYVLCERKKNNFSKNKASPYFMWVILYHMA